MNFFHLREKNLMLFFHPSSATDVISNCYPCLFSTHPCLTDYSDKSKDGDLKKCWSYAWIRRGESDGVNRKDGKLNAPLFLELANEEQTRKGFFLDTTATRKTQLPLNVQIIH